MGTAAPNGETVPAAGSNCADRDNQVRRVWYGVSGTKYEIVLYQSQQAAVPSQKKSSSQLDSAT